MKFEWITDWETIWSDDFINQWIIWMDKSENAHVFFHPAMVKAWVDTYMPIRDISPLFCVVKEGDSTIFMPLILWKRNWKNAFINTIVPVGYSDFDYSYPILIGNKTSINWDLFWLNIQNEIRCNWSSNYDILEIDGIKKQFTSKLPLWEESDACPFINLKEYSSSESFTLSLSSNQRSDYRRRLRRLKEQGDFKFEVLGSDKKSEIFALLPSLLVHHSLRWPNAYKAPNFHHNLITNALDENLLHLSQISIDNEPIAWIVSFIYKKTYYFYMPVYVEKYTNYSPGKMILYLCILETIDKDYEIFDLLRGAEAYKNKLPVENDAVFACISKNNGFVSTIKESLLQLRKHLI